MTTTSNATSPDRLRLRALAFALMLCCVPALAGAGSLGPTFTKTFMPDTIGPGSVSMLIFTISNTERPAASDLAFTDVLPGGMTLAAPAFVSNTCGGIVSAPDGGTTVTFSEGMVGANRSCKIVVNVTAATPGEGPYTNTSGDLTSSAGNSGPAMAELTVDAGRPGFTKSFSPSSVSHGGRSTLTFTIDNSLNASAVPDLDFTDILPPGMVVADPSNKSTTCVNPSAFFTTVVTAVPGSNQITLDANGSAGFPVLAAGATCTVSVDVIGGAVGTLGNVSGELLSDFSSVSSGKAANVLEVTGSESPLSLTKEFTDDPVAPGGLVTLQFTVSNRSRDEAATGISFSDDLDATLSGLTPILPPTPDPPCGPGSSLDLVPPPPVAGSRTSAVDLVLTGGELPPEGSCTFSVVLAVPPGATPGVYPNTAGPVMGTVGGEGVTGNLASDLLFVVPFPILTKEFIPGAVGTGGTVTLEFTITNPSVSAMSDIGFIDELTDNTGDPGPAVGNGFLPFPVSVTLPGGSPCGGSLALVSLGTDRQGLELTGGSLAANNGMPGGPDECTFSVTVDIPPGLAPGTYTNTTEEISATLDDAAGTPTVVGPPASDDIVVVAAPQLSKEFTDDPVAPGGTVTLEFTLQNLDPDNAATAIAFDDDLGATLTGLTLTSVLSDTCGGTVSGVGTDMFGYSGGSLAPDDGVPDSGPDQCTIALSLTVPASPPGPPGGIFPNTTTEPTATVAGVAAGGAAASDNLVVSGLVFTKEFTPDTVIAGGSGTLTFTLDNTTGAADVTFLSFSDVLDPAIVAALPPVPDPPCGAGSSLTITDPPGPPTQSLDFFSATPLTAGSMCSFSVPFTVAPGALDDTYLNATTGNFAIIGGFGVSLPPATDTLTVNSTLLALSKEFTDDPVNPGDPVTLKFTLENLSATETVTDIEFSDDLEAALSSLVATGALMNTCGGMATSGFPTGLFSYVGGTLAPGASCMIVLTLDVPPGPLPGNVFPNTTSGVTGRTGDCPAFLTLAGGRQAAPPPCVFGDPASDNLRVDTLTFEKSFDGPTTATGTAVLSFTIINLDSVSGVSGLAFSDNLDALISGLVATPPPSPNPPCGAGSMLAGTSFLTFTNGSLPPAGSCTFSVTVTVPGAATPGSFLNTTGGLFSFGAPVAEPATDFLEIEPPPTFAKVFAPDLILVNGVSTLTFTIDNSASALPASGLDFTDNLPAAVVVAAPSNASTTCTGGTLTAASGTSVVSYNGGTVAAGASCTVQVDVTSATPGMHVNVSGDLTSSSGNSGPASDTLTVQAPPGFAKMFAPNPVGETFDTTLTFTIDNTASTLAVDDLDFLDMLPFDLVVAAAPGVMNTCGGSVVAAAGSTTISLSNGSLAAGATCTISVQVNAPSPGGPFVNITGDLTSTLGNSGTASDTLTVNPCTAADGLDASVTGLVLGTLNVEVCKTATLGAHLKVDGPAGDLTVEAGISVIFLNGTEFGAGSTVTITIDPSLIP